MRFVAFLCCAAGISLPAAAGRAEEPAADAAAKYLLRYKFHAGEVLRWETRHSVKVRTTVAGSTQLAETDTASAKVWRVLDARDNGRAAFEHSVEFVRMLSRVTGREDVLYDSRTDSKPPPGYEDAAARVGIPLTRLLIDARGGVIERRDKFPDMVENALAQMTIPLPEEPVAAGDSWKVPSEIQIRLKDGSPRKVQLRQVYTLEKVETGVATIRYETQILTPSNHPEVQVALVQRKTAGHVRFDVEAGRMLAHEQQVEDRVVGFQTEASSMLYQSRFVEQLAEQPATARKPQPLGPQPAAR